ncbi:MAG: A/G-specific adenine glycosylase [Phycisphaerae bacterium]|nr:MAG: A/G-specific adenine glycosylase [Phycisphaerae bacterium]
MSATRSLSLVSFRRRLLGWYDLHRREMPWRTHDGQTPDPYHVWVSEVMLQQTQVATVIPYFRRFIDAFPTLESLARADESSVLRLWQGLGYYSRGLNLLKAARMIVLEFDGQIPHRVDQLITLPGIGRYTAGAIASIAYNAPAPVVDGNVVRVLARFDAIPDDPRNPRIMEQLWQRAQTLVCPRRPGDFNQALMELGATVCTPRQPDCQGCPLKIGCLAFRSGTVERIPPPKRSKLLPVERRLVLCVRNRLNQYLIQKRPPTGRWAGLWQFLTLVRSSERSVLEQISELSRRIGLNLTDLKPLTTLCHTLTHRKYVFEVWSGKTDSVSSNTPNGLWSSLDQMEGKAFSKPHLLIRARLSP